MRSALSFLALLVAAAPLAAQSTPAPAPAPAPAQTGYGSWFGSIPDVDQDGQGIVLTGVSSGSPAEKAGLKANDIIVMMAGKETPGLAEMVAVLRAHKPGETIEVVFWRGEEKKTVKVTLGLRPGA